MYINNLVLWYWTLNLRGGIEEKQKGEYEVNQLEMVTDNKT